MQYRIFSFVLFLFTAASAIAQCPMCKAVAEAGRREGSNKAAGLNNGILYLLVLPYLAITIIGFLWYRKAKLQKQNEKKIKQEPSLSNN
ncbi:MAG: hypothetical protein ACKVTZ_00410 [Bacteroidia bacterium]